MWRPQMDDFGTRCWTLFEAPKRLQRYPWAHDFDGTLKALFRFIVGFEKQKKKDNFDVVTNVNYGVLRFWVGMSL